MGMGFAPTWFCQVSPPPLLHKTTLTTASSPYLFNVPSPLNPSTHTVVVLPSSSLASSRSFLPPGRDLSQLPLCIAHPEGMISTFCWCSQRAVFASPPSAFSFTYPANRADNTTACKSVGERHINQLLYNWIMEQFHSQKLVQWGTDGRLPLIGDFRSLILE